MPMLAGFNGVEIAQLAIAALTLPVLWRLGLRTAVFAAADARAVGRGRVDRRDLVRESGLEP